MGGLLAYELIKIFINNGDAIGKLIIIDSFMPNQVQELAPLTSMKDFIALFLRMSLITKGKIQFVESAVLKVHASLQPFDLLMDLLKKHQLFEYQQDTQINLMLKVLELNYLALNQYIFSLASIKVNGCFVYADQTINIVERFNNSLFKQAIFHSTNLIVLNAVMSKLC